MSALNKTIFRGILLPGLLALAMILALALPVPGAAAELRVEVTGLRSPSGVVRMALFANPEDFPDNDKKIASKDVKVNGLSTRAVFKNLSAGNYAVAVFHDENENNIFDRGFLGIPLEGYGFSNNARVILSPPEFAAAAVSLTEGRSDISVTINY
ncbi:MAG: DUF2141 domain-containing protein [Rhodospirillales bacterium]|nr:DUF2141 domain-containing protein [Rhodospirillales bacterium]